MSKFIAILLLANLAVIFAQQQLNSETDEATKVFNRYLGTIAKDTQRAYTLENVISSSMETKPTFKYEINADVVDPQHVHRNCNLTILGDSANESEANFSCVVESMLGAKEPVAEQSGRNIIINYLKYIQAAFQSPLKFRNLNWATFAVVDEYQYVVNADIIVSEKKTKTCTLEMYDSLTQDNLSNFTCTDAVNHCLDSVECPVPMDYNEAMLMFSSYMEVVYGDKKAPNYQIETAKQQNVKSGPLYVITADVEPEQICILILFNGPDFNSTFECKQSGRDLLGVRVEMDDSRAVSMAKDYLKTLSANMGKDLGLLKINKAIESVTDSFQYNINVDVMFPDNIVQNCDLSFGVFNAEFTYGFSKEFKASFKCKPQA